MEDRFNDLKKLAASFERWDKQLDDAEDKIVALEQDVIQKELAYQALEQNLQQIDVWQAKFDEILSIFEDKNPKLNKEQTTDVMEMIKSMYRELDIHEQEIDEIFDNLEKERTLKSLLFLMADVYSRYKQVRDAAIIYQLVDVDDERENDDDFL